VSSPSTAPVLVTAANGRTGRAVLRALHARGARTRAYIRSTAQWPALGALGATEYAVGDLGDTDRVHAALDGCSAVVYIGPPMHPDEKALAGGVFGAATALGVPHLVYYSVMHPLRTEVRHHRLKLETEEALVESGAPYTIVQPMRYMQHLEPIWPSVCESGVHAMPFNTRVAFNVADLEDLAAATATVVVERDRWLFGTYELAGPEALSQDDMARIIGEVLGRPIAARAVPIEAMQAKARAAGASEDRIAQMTAMNRHYDAHGFLGNPSVLRLILGREPTRFRDYVRRIVESASTPRISQ
jgi:uncharacterized protein YbjT (DUF2867 family)